MKVPPHPSKRSTKRSNLIMERPLTSRRDLIRPDFRGAGIQFLATQRFARSARTFFIPHAKPLSQSLSPTATNGNESPGGRQPCD